MLEARWSAAKANPADGDGFKGEIARKLDNTFGLFLSMNGFDDTAVQLHSSGWAVMMLMVGSDLSAVIEGRMALHELLARKRQRSAGTGSIFVRACEILV